MSNKEKEEPLDRRLVWMEQRYNQALKMKPLDAKKFIENEDNRTILLEFFEVAERKNVFIVGTVAGPFAALCGEYDPATKFAIDYKRKIFFFMKYKREKLTDDKLFASSIAFGDVNVDMLQFLHQFTDQFLLPLMQIKQNVSRVPAVCFPALMESTHKLLATSLVTMGRSHHRTLLPIPPIRLPASVANNVDVLGNKELVRELEMVVTSWIAMIREAVELRPEGLRQLLRRWPGPIDELNFWEEKLTNLRGLDEQMSRTFSLKMIVVLRQNGSNYAAMMEGAVTEIRASLAEASECCCYLRPMRELFELVQVQSPNHISFDRILPDGVFWRIFRLLYETWCRSKHFSTTPRMVNLISEMTTDIIASAVEAVDPTTLFTSERQEVIKNITSVLHVCGHFKAVFFHFKGRSAKELQRPWRFQNAALFRRLDAFLERLHDVLDVLETAALFERAANIRIGGSDGIALSNEVDVILANFGEEFTRLQEASVGFLDIDDAKFDDVYGNFRHAVHRLEERMAKLMSAAFEDVSSMAMIFKLVESFDSFAERPILHQEWASKQMLVLRTWKQELLNLQEHFSKHRGSSITFLPNVPPTAAAIIWGNALLARLDVSRTKMGDLDASVLKSQTGLDSMTLYEKLRTEIRQYIVGTHDQWTSTVGEIGAEKLHCTLLVHHEGSGEYAVNFDKALVCVLKEVLYLDQLQQQDDTLQPTPIPQQVITIHRSREQLRHQVLKLDYVCTAVNKMNATLAPEELALIRSELDSVAKLLHIGVTTLTWASSEAVDEYIISMVKVVAAVEDVYKLLKHCLADVRQFLVDLAAEDKFLPLTAMKGDAKVLTEGEFRKKAGDYFATRTAKIELLHRRTNDELLTNTLHALNSLKAMQHLPTIEPKVSDVWSNYLNFVTGEIGGMFVTLVSTTLLHLQHQLDEQWLSSNHGLPLLDIKLALQRPKDSHYGGAHAIVFEPPLQSEKPHVSSVASTIEQFISNLLTLTEAFSIEQAANSAGAIRLAVESSTHIEKSLETIRQLVRSNEKKCESFTEHFSKHSELYCDNIQAKFEEFIQREVAAVVAEANTAALKAQEQSPTPLVTVQPVIPFHFFHGVPLSKFDSMIRRYEMLLDDLEDLPLAFITGFVKIDAKLIRTAIHDLCGRWRDAYSGCLIGRITTELEDLYSFIAAAEKELEREVEEGDFEGLKTLMRWIRDCRQRNDRVTSMLVPVSEAVGMLKSHPSALPTAQLDRLEALRKPAADVWGALYRKCMNTRERYSAQQDRESERLREDTLAFEARVSNSGCELRASDLFTFEMDRNAAYRHIDNWGVRFRQLEQEARVMAELEDLFELASTEFRELRESRSDLVVVKHVWDFVNHVCVMFEDWMSSTFADVDVEGFMEEVKRLQKQLKTQPVKAKEWPVYKGLDERVVNMSKSLPLCAELRTPAMRDRHWDKLLKAAKQSGKVDPKALDFTLERLISLGLHKHAEEVYTIVEKAQKELIIERNLTKIIDTWEKMAFEYEANEGLNISLLCSVDAVVEQVETDNNSLQSMLSDRFVEFFLERVQQWQRNIGTVDTCMTKWVEIQRKWVNLYPIFVMSADIREQLPEDSKRFIIADEMYRRMMAVAPRHTNVINILCSRVLVDDLDWEDDLDSYLQAMEDVLVRCEKSLTEYLETKRKIFPRFFFVSSADLVDILSKGSDPKAVMVHMSKIVDSIETFLIDDNPNGSTHPKKVWELVSIQGEHVRLSEDYICEGPVEDWLDGCITAMQKTIRMHIAEANAGYVEKPRTEWIYQYPCQAVIVASRSWYTAECQQAFQMMEDGSDTAMKDFLKLQRAQLDVLIKEVLLDRKSNERKMLVHLITIDVHNRDIVQQLVDEKTDSVDAFAWQSQLRYYWDDKRGSEIRICDAEFQNGYEYVGLCGCLVITKLTDRCYTTLSQALRLKRGGAPAGPAGTGKTETTKDLARNLGIACYVFNCSDQMNYVTLGQIFKGLAMSGSWGCFDEFNRISIEVLSVVATQVGSILNALKSNKKRFRFMDEEISVINKVGMFITMNPGYAGRTELPENIKSLFRPCAMCVPDLKNICEIMLAAEGFVEAKDLALKFVTLYRLNKELLSPQDHYDWGLRAVKSVLYIAGSLRRGDPDVPERKVLMRALRDTNLAKLSKDDVYVFMGLIKSLFPQLEAPKKDKPELSEALKSSCGQLGFFYGDNDIFILKCLQYEEILHVRHSVFILGPSGCGKTACYKTLQVALSKLGDKCATSALNPKAVSSNELYGFIHPQTKEWKDGILSNIFRQFALESKTKKNSKWIVLDGIVDAEWIESMNTVMDDNKMLTLVSNERIPLTESMRMIFEVSQLRNASPATVSRGGVVFINESDLGWGPFKDRWIATRESKEGVTLDTLFDRFVPTALDYFHRVSKPIVAVLDIAIVQTICNLLEGLLKGLKERTQEVYEKYFAFAVVWAFGGPLPSDGRVDFRLNFSNWWRKENPGHRIGETGTVFDHFIDASDNYEFKPWSKLVMPYKHDPDVPLGNVSVQTADTVRMRELMSLLMDNGKPVMLVGTAGTGKSNLIMAKLRTLDNEQTIFRVIAFNARTSSAGLQSVMEQSLEKRSGRQFGPINRKKLILFLDDINMPNPDKYGTQDAIALLQQHINYGYWYDRVKIIQKEVVDVRYVAAMNPKSGTFTILDRVLRHFALFSANMPDRDDLTRIYGQILASHLSSQFGRDVVSMADAITTATIELHSRVTKEFLPTAVLFFYQWNMRELFNIFQGVCKSTKKLHNEPAIVVRLWAHECYRTFQDRMPRDDDIKKFEDIMTAIKGQCFPELTSSGALQPVGVWAPFRTTKDGEENVYDECDSTFVSAFLQTKLNDYNSNYAVMDLVLFTQAAEHVCRIARVTSNPRGNALLVGVGGSGKQSLARLASSINGHDIFQIQVTSTYGIANFRTDVQDLYKKCGLKGLPYALIITDQQLVSMDMLVYLNDMLNSGNVPELFIGDEKDAVTGAIAGEVKQMGLPVTTDSCWAYFIDKVRTNLHIVLCMSPVGKTFAQWCRQFPALANTTVIDWFHPWPQQALQSVALKFLSTIELGGAVVTKNIAEFMADCQQEVTSMSDKYFAMEKRRCFTTPKSFLELIALYKDLLARKRDELTVKTERLVAGIDKIRDAAQQVAELQVVLQKESIEVAEASEKTAKLMEHVGREKSVVEEQSTIAAVEEEKTNKIVVEVERFAADCAADLAAAKPLVDEAMAALNTLDKASLTELKSMARPPEDVVMVCAAVKCLTSAVNKIPPQKTRDWSNCKTMMANVSQWMKDLLAFDQNNIPQPCIDAIQMYVTNPAFDPASIISKSFAASGLCKWVLGMNAYHKVRCLIIPKEIKLQEAQERLAGSKAALKKVQDKVADLKAKLDGLMKQYEAAVDASQKIAARAQKTKSKMALAERLVGGLADEKIRWGKTIDGLRTRNDLLVGDVLIAAAFVSYIGPFTRKFRDMIVQDLWVPNVRSRGILMTSNLDIVMDILTTEAAVASWNNDGLPNDPVSTQNGSIIVNCSRWPLMIDPQLQGVRWIRTKEEKNGLVVVQPGQKFFIEKIVKCVEEGLPCIIESCGETIDPVLDNVLGRVTFRRGNKQLMRIGAVDVEFNKNFRLYLQTRLSNPMYKPEVNAQTTIINFMVTESGLEDQLLAVVVNQERNDLEEKRVALLRMMNVMTIELQQCEDGLLLELSNATGDILENVTLVENLEATKRKANEINRSMADAVTTQSNIAKLRRNYQPVAERGSLLFFQLDQLCKIDHMYQYSLEAFMVVLTKLSRRPSNPRIERTLNCASTTSSVPLQSQSLRTLRGVSLSATSLSFRHS
jgi:dynein heavy chain